MGLKDTIKRASASYKVIKEHEAAEKKEKAKHIFSEQGISITSEIDEKAAISLFEALKERKEIFPSSEYAMEEHDENIYNLCKAIMYQNFMLLRRIDELTKRIEAMDKD